MIAFLYDIIPHSRHSKLKDFMAENKSMTYILKPDIGSKGIGIYLTKSIKNITQHEKMICQLYVAKVNAKNSKFHLPIENNYLSYT